MISETAHAECVRLLELLTNPRVQESWSWVFMTPVDIPGYDKVIKKPMDLGTIKKNLGVKPSRCRFKSHEKFARDVRLVFQNALVYNKDDQDVKGSVYAAAQHLLRVFETAYAKAIDNVFRADDAAKAAHREAKVEKRRAEGGDVAKQDGEEKKSKKSKKKSKDREKDREHKHSSSSSGESKKKSHRSEHEGGVASSSSAVAKDVVPIVSRRDVAPPAPTSSSAVPAASGLDSLPGLSHQSPESYASYGVQKKLRSGSYATIDAFAYDMRLIFSNCLVYNSDVILSKVGGSWPGVPERWKCHQIIHEILAHRTDGQETAQWFKYPVESYYDSPDQIPYNYFKTVKNPMDIGTVSSKLHLGEYKHVSEFIAGMKLVFDNCIRYWKPDPQGQTYLSSSGAAREKQRPSSSSSSKVKSVSLVRIPPPRCQHPCLQSQLRAHKMKGFRGIEIKTAGPFLTAVDTTKYPDYLKIVSEPMDFAKIERKLKSDRGRRDIRAMATNLRNYFVELCNEKLGPLDGMVNGPTHTPTHSAQVASVPSSLASTQPKPPAALARPEAKVHTAAVTGTGSSSLHKPMKKSPAPSPTKRPSSASSSASLARDPKKNIKALKPEPALISAATPAISTKSCGSTGLTPEEAKRLRKEMKEKRKKEKKEKKEKKKKKREKKEKKERSKIAATQAPPSAAIASKRGLVEPHLASSSASSKKSKKHKKSDLNSWETACDRVLNCLGKIEQVAKLHFNHPLLEVFPHLATEYTSLITEPMDLRTLREQLHAHALTPAEFLRKGRLTFQNAVKFNCADDPASVQVRDMSAHLMWYFDSLCAELQILPASEVPGEQSREKRNQLRRERAEFVNTVPVELKAKECQKLLRVLNSQKYDKNCWPFRKPVRVLFPALSPDYFEIVKTPMDLSTIAEKLNEFEYKMHGEFIRDVRLTFENAMTYNRADKDREGWSVYSAAVHMLAVVEDLWGDVTLEVMEKTRRRELVRKERMNDSKRKRSDISEVGGEREKKVHKHHHHSTTDGESGHKHHQKHHHKSSKHRTEEAGSATGSTASAATPSKPVVTATSVVGTIVVNGANGSREDSNVSDTTATRVKLQLMPSRPNMERMNKQERKAEEKRRKRARREEEMARTEKRRRTAVAATDDALREAEIRSRRKLQKLEMAEAVRLREERERRAAEEEAERARRAQMKLNAAAWTGVLLPVASRKQMGFWAKKHTKLQIPAAFQPPAINA
ncbi:Bromodomain [Phytophthora cactorum]|nr:Bromodomain [Phytophthora cactorum]